MALRARKASVALKKRAKIPVSRLIRVAQTCLSVDLIPLDIINFTFHFLFSATAVVKIIEQGQALFFGGRRSWLV